MKLSKKYFFLIYFIILYTIVSFILLKTIAQPLINLWEYLIKSIFKNAFNYSAFLFVPICSGVISKSTYLSVVFSFNLSYKKKISLKMLLTSIILIWIANFLRIVFVLWSEKISHSFANTTHILSWFFMGVVILYLALKTIE